MWGVSICGKSALKYDLSIISSKKGFLGFSLCDCDDDHFVGI